MNSMNNPPSSEEIAKNTESRTLSDAELIRDGAHHVASETGQPVLEITEKQINELKELDPSTEDKRPKTELLETFSIPAQTEELDFREFMERTLFGDYFPSRYGSARELIYDKSERFGAIGGGSYKEAKIVGNASQEEIIEELGISPMSLNEWEYLFSSLTRDQLYGNTFFLVKFDDGVVRTIKSTFLNEGGGPYSYSFNFEDMKRERTHQQGSQEDLEARVIFPVSEQQVPQGPENADVLKQQLLDRFNAEGGTEEVGHMFDNWILMKLMETDESGKVEDRLKFEIELANLEITLGRDKKEIISGLEDLIISANQEGFGNLVREIDDLISGLKTPD